MDDYNNYPNMILYEDLFVKEQEIPIEIIRNAYYERDLYYKKNKNKLYLLNQYNTLQLNDQKIKDAVDNCDNKLFYDLLSIQQLETIGW